jgi:drug/metabolite transporter (DMT)-like permease
MSLFFAGLPHLPLAHAVTLQYTEAIFVVLLAISFLREKFRGATAISVLVGFSGVFVISWNGAGAVSLAGIALVLMSALFGAGSIIQIKRLSRTENSASIVLYFTAIAMVLSGLSLFFAWITPTWSDLLLLAIIGILAGCGQLFLTAAFRVSNASFLAPFSYFGVVWAILFGYLLFGEVISLRSAFGSMLVIASALYLSVTNKQPVPDIPGEQVPPS